MSSGGHGTYSLLLQVNAANAISTINQVKTQLGTLSASFTQSNGAIMQSTQSFERWTQAAQKTVGAASPLSGIVWLANGQQLLLPELKTTFQCGLFQVVGLMFASVLYHVRAHSPKLRLLVTVLVY